MYSIICVAHSAHIRSLPYYSRVTTYYSRTIPSIVGKKKYIALSESVADWLVTLFITIAAEHFGINTVEQPFSRQNHC